MNLKFTDEADYNKFSIKMLMVTWLFIGIIIVVGILTVIIDANLLSTSLFIVGFKNNILLPGLLNVVIMAVIHLLSLRLLKSKMYAVQAFLYMFGLVSICFVLARTNQELNINLIFFIIPIVISFVYFDRKVLLSGLIFSSVALSVHIILMITGDKQMTNNSLFPTNIEAAFVMMIAIYIIGLTVINRQERLLETVQKANEKTQEDKMTGFLNHSGFYDDLDMTFKNAEREKGDFCLAIIDIDNFTIVNNEYGYGLGDEVIEIMGNCINKSIVNTAKAYRYGGEEFVIICKGTQEIVINMVDSILRDFKNKTEMKLELVVTASAGICEYDPVHFTGKRDIFAALDEALYAAKRLGKNQYAVWNDALVRDSFVSTGKLVFREDAEEIKKIADIR